MDCVLYAEDEPDDVEFMKRAFSLARIKNPLRVVSSGQDAMFYLSGKDSYADRTRHPIPRLVMLDISLPIINGLDVLQWIRMTPDVRALPVLILTSSNLESDIQRASVLGANGYLVKPNDPHRLLEMVKAIQNYWLGYDRFVTGMVPGKAPKPENSIRVLM